MSLLVDKCDKSLSLIDFLYTNRKYNPIGHSAYYGCFLLMKHIIEKREGTSLGKHAVHDLAKNKMLVLLKHDPLKMKKFENVQEKLWKTRIKVDYTDQKLQPNEASNIIDDANDLVKLLKQEFINDL